MGPGASPSPSLRACPVSLKVDQETSSVFSHSFMINTLPSLSLNLLWFHIHFTHYFSQCIMMPIENFQIEPFRPAKSLFKDLMNKLAIQNLHLFLEIHISKYCIYTIVLLAVSNWFYLEVSKHKDLFCSVYLLFA